MRTDSSSSSDSSDESWSSQELSELAQQLRDGIEVKDRSYRLRKYEKCFVGSEACLWLLEKGLVKDEQQAELLGGLLLEDGHLHHVLREHSFKNQKLFYRFTVDEDHGKTAEVENQAISWHSLVAGELFKDSSQSLIPDIPDYTVELEEMNWVDTWGVAPMDEENARLLDNVRPRIWEDPEPKGRYHMVVIGGGAGGLVTAAACAGVGARVALIEEHLLGGDCLNFGCVPSKVLLSAAKVANTVRKASEFGIRIDGVSEEELTSKVQIDFPKIMQRLRRRRADISKHDAAERFSKELGIDVYLGRGAFTSPNTVEVNGKTLRFSRCCIATGGTPAIPKIEGLAKAPYFTNMTLFNLTELPRRIGVIGTGVVGVEMAQAFQRFGSQVTLFSRSSRILPKEDPEASAVVFESLKRDGLNFVSNARYRKVRTSPIEEGEDYPVVTVELERGEEYPFDALVVATGRKPNLMRVRLEKAGVKSHPGKGVLVDDYLRTSAKHIFAVGDVATKYQFTHIADFMARIVVRNSLFYGKSKFSDLIIPWCTYTDPELAHVGLYEGDLKARGIPFQTFTRYFKDVDRSVVEEKTSGFVKVHVKKGSDQILGATIVGEHAGEMISEVTLAMQSGTGLSKLANVIHPYPTAAEAIRQVGDQYNKTRMTPTVRKLFRGLLSLQ